VRHKGQRLSFEEMTLNLAAIIESNEQRASDDSSGGVGQQQQHFPPLGLLTTANRRLWAQWRHQLLQGAAVIVNPLLFLSFLLFSPSFIPV
jgi:hypothetical protein